MAIHRKAIETLFWQRSFEPGFCANYSSSFSMTNPRRVIPAPLITGGRIGALAARQRTNGVADCAKPPDAAARAGRTHACTVAQSGQPAFPLVGGVVERTAGEVDQSGEVAGSPSRDEDSGKFGKEALEHGQLSGMTTVADAIARKRIDLPGTTRRVAQSRRRCRFRQREFSLE
ncbi:hypothetical protein [Paraburkholderia sp. JHI869]|uniref:hypothetical protein n=1 Tax=Paraburkholderia sp. JHI869 TaxID=3112959 RepID=UPI0031795E85